MLMISEDNSNVVSSIMLSRVLDIKFNDGNGGLGNYLKNKNDVLFLYPDSVPDNINTRNIPTNFEQRLKSLGNTNNILLFPIPCIEYLIILGLYEINFNFNIKVKWLSKVVDCVIAKKTIANEPPRDLVDYSGKFSTFEKQCKLVIENLPKEFHNYNIEKKKGYESVKSFYLSDTVINDEVFTSEMKGMLVSKQFPVSLYKSTTLFNRFGLRQLTIDEARRVQVEYFSKYKLWVKDIKNCNITLPDKWWEDN